MLDHTNCTGYTKWPGNKSVMLKTSKFWLYLHFWCSHEQKKNFFFCGKIFVMSKKKIFFWATKRPGRPTMVVGRATVGRPKRPSRATKATWSGGQATMVGSEPCSCSSSSRCSVSPLQLKLISFRASSGPGFCSTSPHLRRSRRLRCRRWRRPSDGCSCWCSCWCCCCCCCW